MHTLTGRELDFWRELTAPFQEQSYSWRWLDKAKTREATYIKPRVIMNRLDDVVGPGGWEANYEVSDKGVVCVLSIQVPLNSGLDGIVRRSGGGPWASGDQLTDETQFKAGFMNSFKLAAAAFGIGRELYEEGSPAYNADLHGGWASGLPQLSGTPRQQPPQQQPKTEGGPVNGSAAGDRQPPRYGFAPPEKAGTAVFAWAKSVGEHFDVDVVARMAAYAKTRQQPWKTSEWSQEFTTECLEKTVAWLKNLDKYAGEFDGQQQQQRPEPQQTRLPSQPSAPSDLSGRKRAIMAAASALLQQSLNRAPSDGEVRSAIGNVAASVLNGRGHRGEVLDSLRDCQDDRWLANILSELQQQIARQAKVAVDDEAGAGDDIPF